MTLLPNLPTRAAYVVALAFGIVLVVGGLAALMKQRRSSGWSTTQGVVTDYSFTESSDDTGRSFSPRVTYRYTVDGTTHQGDVIAQVITCPNTPQQLFERYGCRYPKGAQVVVRYDPARPSDAVLEVVANPWVMLIMPVAGAMLMVLALWHLR